jgi:hypothetical protein
VRYYEVLLKDVTNVLMLDRDFQSNYLSSLYQLPVCGTLLICVDLSSDQHDVTQEDQSGDRSVFKGENQCRVVLALYRWGVTVVP